MNVVVGRLYTTSCIGTNNEGLCWLPSHTGMQCQQQYLSHYLLLLGTGSRAARGGLVTRSPFGCPGRKRALEQEALRSGQQVVFCLAGMTGMVCHVIVSRDCIKLPCNDNKKSVETIDDRVVQCDSCVDD